MNNDNIATKHRRRFLPEWAGRTMWQLNVAALCALAAWIFLDGKFSQTAQSLATGLQSAFDSPDDPANLSPHVTWRAVALGAFLVCAAGSLAGIFIALFMGATRHRRLWTWLALTLLIAVWLSLVVSWREVAWQGQRWRLHSHLSEFNAIAASLRADWPGGDGERAELGAFLAYPHGQPRTLLLLTPPTVKQTGIPFSAVERSDNGALRFELAGAEAGSWLECQPPDQVPESFVSGLTVHYELERFAKLGSDWFLARYDATTTAGDVFNTRE